MGPCLAAAQPQLCHRVAQSWPTADAQVDLSFLLVCFRDLPFALCFAMGSHIGNIADG
jgi:hypothetical protein